MSSEEVDLVQFDWPDEIEEAVEKLAVHSNEGSEGEPPEGALDTIQKYLEETLVVAAGSETDKEIGRLVNTLRDEEPDGDDLIDFLQDLETVITSARLHDKPSNL